jgi:integrase
LCEFFAGKTFEQITPMLVEKYKKERREGLAKRGSQRRPATVNRELAVLSKIFTLAVDAGVAVSNPCLRVRKLRQDNERTRYLSYEEEAGLMQALAAEDQLRRIVTLAINTGMRRGEIFSLCWPDVDFARGVIYVRHTKTGKDRAVPMNVIGRAALEEQQRTSEHVFVSPRTGGPYVDIKRAFTAALQQAGIEDFRFHDLRHTAATRLADTGADVFTIAEILGHSSLAMTKRYTHATDEAKQRAVERLAEKANSCLNFASKQKRQAG